MILTEIEVFDVCEQLAIKKVVEGLKKQGFETFTNHKLEDKIRGGALIIDLYAESKTEKRVYEFKIVGNKHDYKELSSIKELKNYAKEIDAKFMFVAISLPIIKTIEFDEIGSLLMEYFNINETPGEIDCLSTHSRIEEISDCEINSIRIYDGKIVVEGDARMTLSLQIGSDGDCRRGDGLESSEVFDFTFTATIEHKEISELEYEINTDSFYE